MGDEDLISGSYGCSTSTSFPKPPPPLYESSFLMPGSVFVHVIGDSKITLKSSLTFFKKTRKYVYIFQKEVCVKFPKTQFDIKCQVLVNCYIFFFLFALFLFFMG